MADTQKMRAEQLKLSRKIITKDQFDKIELIAGVDQAYFDDFIISAISVLDYNTLDVKEAKYSIKKSKLRYMPGYLFYREAEAIMDAFHNLERMPDLIIFDCNGILHPRRIGMASHIGLLLDISTIGVAKKLLCGELKGDEVWYDGEIRAKQIETRDHSNPVFVSAGHKVSLKTAVDIIRKCTKEGHKLPEPVHQAHKYANKIKKRKNQ